MSKKLQTEAIDDKNRSLTKTQRAFVEAYLRLDMNVKGAGREIWGVKYPRSYTQKAWEMFRLPHVKAEIDKRVAGQLHDLGYNKDHLIKEWMKLANADASDFVEWELRYDPESQTYTPIIRMKPSSEVDGACIKSVKIGRTGKIEFELYDKTVAMKQVGEIMGLYPKTQQVEITGKDGGVIEIEDVRSKLLERLNKISGRTGDDESQPESTVPERDDG
jgi:phage terminase small subunit